MHLVVRHAAHAATWAHLSSFVVGSAMHTVLGLISGMRAIDGAAARARRVVMNVLECAAIISIDAGGNVRRVTGGQRRGSPAIAVGLFIEKPSF